MNQLTLLLFSIAYTFVCIYLCHNKYWDKGLHNVFIQSTYTICWYISYLSISNRVSRITFIRQRLGMLIIKRSENQIIKQKIGSKTTKLAKIWWPKYDSLTEIALNNNTSRNCKFRMKIYQTNKPCQYKTVDNRYNCI